MTRGSLVAFESPLLVAILVSCVVLFTGLGVDAQTLHDFPAVGITTASDCGSVPLAWDASAFIDAPGMIDLWLYPIVEDSDGPTDAVRFGVELPSGWEVRDIEICAGSLTWTSIGNTYGFEIDYSGLEMSGVAAVRLVVDASIPGEVLIADHPVTHVIEYRHVSGGWMPNSGVGQPWATVGPLAPCQRSPMSYPGDFCSLSNGNMYPGGLLLPSVLTLASNTVHVEQVAVINRTCDVGPCASGWIVHCIESVSTDVDWVSISGFEDDPFTLTIDTNGVEPGTYSVDVIYGGRCARCERVCTSLIVNVGPVPVDPATWGWIKAIHRD